MNVSNHAYRHAWWHSWMQTHTCPFMHADAPMIAHTHCPMIKQMITALHACSRFHMVQIMGTSVKHPTNNAMQYQRLLIRNRASLYAYRQSPVCGEWQRHWIRILRFRHSEASLQLGRVLGHVLRIDVKSPGASECCGAHLMTHVPIRIVDGGRVISTEKETQSEGCSSNRQSPCLFRLTK